MGIIVFWAIMGGVVGMIASSKGKSGGAWFVYGLLIWPIALAHILVTPADTKVVENTKLQAGGKKCDQCAEIIKREAQVCRFCGNREFKVANSGYDGPVQSYPPTTWQRLWWNPGGQPKKRK